MMIKDNLNYIFIIFVFLFFVLAAINLPYIYFKGITFSSIVFLALLYIFFDKKLKIKIPFFILFLIFVGILIDALGNFFDFYGKKIWFFWYDQMSHLIGTAILGFSVFWLIDFLRKGNRLLISKKTALILVFTITVTLATFYEVIELWDELLYKRERIWGEYDTARDLQWDMIGGLAGVAIGHVIFRRTKNKR